MQASPSAILLVILVGLLISVLGIDYTILNFFRGIYKAVCCKRKKVIAMKYGNYNEEKENIVKKTLSTYDIKENETYAPLIEAMESSEM